MYQTICNSPPPKKTLKGLQYYCWVYLCLGFLKGFDLEGLQFADHSLKTLTKLCILQIRVEMRWIKRWLIGMWAAVWTSWCIGWCIGWCIVWYNRGLIYWVICCQYCGRGIANYCLYILDWPMVVQSLSTPSIHRDELFQHWDHRSWQDGKHKVFETNHYIIHICIMYIYYNIYIYYNMI